MLNFQNIYEIFWSHFFVVMKKMISLIYDHFKKQPTTKNMTKNAMKMDGNPYFITFSNTPILVSSSVFNALNLMESNTM